MGSCLSSSKKTVGWGEILETRIIDDYESAGVVFTDFKHILAGYQPHKTYPCITGIGGKREDGETYLQTALREAVEELYNVDDVSPKLIRRLINHLKPTTVSVEDTYVIVVYDFNSLVKLMKIVKEFGVNTENYDGYPLTLIDLIQNRAIFADSEISHLVLLPFINHTSEYPLVHREFIQDMIQLNG